MSKIDDGGPAFPCEGGPQSGLHAAPGMSLREWYAGQAMLTANPFDSPQDIAERCVEMADAMVAALKGGAT